MSELVGDYLRKVELIKQISERTNTTNVGECYEKAHRIFIQLDGEGIKQVAEYFLIKIRDVARRADVGWIVFGKPIFPARQWTDKEIIQIVTLVGSLHELTYCFERLDYVTFFIGQEPVTTIRFYINSAYHYLAAFFLLDRGTDLMGGTVYKTLLPMKLAFYVNPIRVVLKKKIAKGVTLGGAIKNIRNDFLVHGDFSPEGTDEMVKRAGLWNPHQMRIVSSLMWEAFNDAFILKLRLISLLTRFEPQLKKATSNYQRKNFDDYI